MKEIYILLIAFLFAVVVLGQHYFFKWYQYRRECKRDEKKKKELDKLLGDNPGCENEELLLTHPKDWEVYSYN